MTALEFLQSTRQEVLALANRIERDADVYLPRGFALRRAASELKLAIKERSS